MLYKVKMLTTFLVVICLGSFGAFLPHEVIAQESSADDDAIERKVADLTQQNDELKKRVAALEEKPTGSIAVGGIQFKPYGWVQFDAAVDTSRSAFDDIMFYAYPDGIGGAGKQDLTISARGTRLGVNISAPENRDIKVTGRFEVDFFDDPTPNKYVPRLRLAYMELAWGNGWSVRFGQDWDTFVNFHPTMVDASILAYQGHPYGRHPQIRLTKKTQLNQRTALTTKIAVQHGRNGSDLDSDGQPDENAAASPNIHGSLVLETGLLTDKASVFTISGTYGREKVRGAVAHPGTYRSLFIHGGMQLPLTSRFTFMGEGWAGENIDNYYAAIGQGVNVNKGDEISALGGWLQGLYQVSKNLKTGIGYGVDDPEDADLDGNARTFNDRVFANFIYNLTDKVTIGLEYSHLRTDYAQTRDMDNHRIHLGVMYYF